MNSGYWKGVALGLAACLGVGAGIYGWLPGAPAVPAAKSLVFDPPLVSELQPWILPGQSREFRVQFHNRGRTDAVIDELRTSCPCTVGTLGDTGRFPVSIRAGDTAEVHLSVTSARGERGRVEVRFGVIGRIGNERVTPGALAEFIFVQPLNADPPLVPLGAFQQKDAPKTATVSVWAPAELVPTAELTVESSEPALTVVLTPVAADERQVPQATSTGQNVRVPLGTLTITLHPELAPERLKADVIVRAGTDELRVPVLGLLDSSPSQETARD